jgi:hypothetical protein
MRLTVPTGVSLVKAVRGLITDDLHAAMRIIEGNI